VAVVDFPAVVAVVVAAADGDERKLVVAKNDSQFRPPLGTPDTRTE
jgi:hypothetical protein